MKLAIFLSLCLVTAPVVAIQQEGNTFTLSDEEMAECIEGGGCVFATRQQIIEAMKSVHEKALMGCGKVSGMTKT
jgi:hypothetical protein